MYVTVRFLVLSPYTLRCRRCNSTACENVELASASSVHALGWGTWLYSVSTANTHVHSSVDLQTNKHDTAAACGECRKKSHWRREPKEGIDCTRQRIICFFDCWKCLPIEECRRSLRAPHLLSLTTFLRLGNLETTFVWVRSLGHELVRTRNSMFVSPLAFCLFA